LFELGRREEQPLVEMRALHEIARHQTGLGMLLGEVEDDRDGLGEHNVAVDEHRELSGGVERQELGFLVLAFRLSTLTDSKGTPISWSVQRTRIERVGGKP